MLKDITAAFVPNRAISANTLRIIVAFQVAILVLIWINSPFPVLPQPGEVARAFSKLWFEQGLGRELWTSFTLNLEALGLTLLISLALSYLTVMPFFRPVAAAISKGRFLGLIGLTFVFTLMVGGGRPLEARPAGLRHDRLLRHLDGGGGAAIPKEKFDHARTLRMSEWRVVWEVVILGTADKAFEVLRQNAAIGWMMLTMVEGISRSEGGVGAMLLNQNKHFHLAEVFAIQITILLVGMLQDYGIGALAADLSAPTADLTLERR